MFFHTPHCRRYQWKSLSRLTWICSSLRRRVPFPWFMKWNEMTETWCDDDMEISGKTHRKNMKKPMPSLYIVKHSIIFSCFHKTFVCQAQWMPETSHSQWRNRTSCLPWNYQGSAAEVGTMCDINWITLRSFCISNKCLDVVNMFLKAGMQPRTFRSFVLRFYLISTCWQHKDPALGYCQGMNMVVQSRASWELHRVTLVVTCCPVGSSFLLRQRSSQLQLKVRLRHGRPGGPGCEGVNS